MFFSGQLPHTFGMISLQNELALQNNDNAPMPAAPTTTIAPDQTPTTAPTTAPTTTGEPATVSTIPTQTAVMPAASTEPVITPTSTPIFAQPVFAPPVTTPPIFAPPILTANAATAATAAPAAAPAAADELIFGYPKQTVLIAGGAAGLLLFLLSEKGGK